MLHRVFASGLIAGSLACSASTNDETSAAQIRTNLETSFGGYDKTDESPSFADDAVRAVPKFDVAFASTADQSASSQPMSSYRVTLLWGHLPAANDASDADMDAKPATWTGSISVDSGSIDVLRTLSFDEGDAIDARTMPNALSFTSHTLPFVDGVLLRVRVLAGGGNAQLHFSTTELSTNVDLDAITIGAGSVAHVDGDQGLVAVGWNDTGARCPVGIAYGRFVKLAGAVGVIRAHVMGDDGADLGDARGIWGHAPARDADVFFGKSIDTTGKFRDLFEGVYATGDMTGTRGDMTTQGGSFTGVYADGLDRADGRGVFVSKWMGTCSAF